MSSDELKNFEKDVKVIIISKFQNYLSKESIELIQNKDYSNDFSNIDNQDINIIKSDLIRKIFDDLINVTCVLNYEVSKGNFEKLTYGKALEIGLIENYSLEVAKSKQLDFRIKPEAKESLGMVLNIYRSMQGNLDNLVFNNNAVEILEISNNDDAIEYFDNMSLLEHKNKKVEQTPVTVKTENLSGGGTFNIIYKNGRKTVKYIDEEGNEHLIKSTTKFDISETYRNAFAFNKKGENVDPKVLFKDLMGQLEEEEKEKAIKAAEKEAKKEKEEKEVPVKEDVTSEVKPEVEEPKEEPTEVETPVVEEKKEETVEPAKEEPTLPEEEVKEEVEETKEDEEEIYTKPYVQLFSLEDDDEELTDEQIEELKNRAISNQITIDELRTLRRALTAQANRRAEQKKAEQEKPKKEPEAPKEEPKVEEPTPVVETPVMEEETKEVEEVKEEAEAPAMEEVKEPEPVVEETHKEEVVPEEPKEEIVKEEEIIPEPEPIPEEVHEEEKVNEEKKEKKSIFDIFKKKETPKEKIDEIPEPKPIPEEVHEPEPIMEETKEEESIIEETHEEETVTEPTPEPEPVMEEVTEPEPVIEEVHEEVIPEPVSEESQVEVVPTEEANELKEEVKEESPIIDETDLMNTVELEDLNNRLQAKKEKLERIKEQKGDKKPINKAFLFFILCIVFSISMIIGVIIAYFK